MIAVPDEIRPGPGAPPLPCNLWLERQLSYGYGPRTLYREWLGRYYDLRGFYPVDRRRSFRAAVTGARLRLRRRGG